LCAEIIEGRPEAEMIDYVMHMLAVKDIEGLPPGGGINAK
jgi:Protein serine/threonine phosphatase 2C, C-terminal domain